MKEVICGHKSDSCPKDCEHKEKHIPLGVDCEHDCDEVEDQCFLIKSKPMCKCIS